MTKTQVSLQEHREAQRSNRVKEAETERSNRRKERETERSNRANESIGREKNATEKTKSIIGLISNLLGSGIKGGLAAANDPSWYNKVGPLTKDTANLPFGRALYRPYSGSQVDGFGKNNLFTPGILTIPCALTIGNPNDGFAAMNVAATKGYTYVRSVNSGQAEGLPPDFIKYVMAIRSILAMIAEAEKVYAVSRAYSSENRYIGRGIIEALGYDADTVYRNQAQFRSHLNRVIVKLGVIAVPKEFSLFQRAVWMFGSTFKDSDSDKAQIIQYRLAGFHRYNDELGFLQWIPKGISVSILDWISDIEDCVDALLDSEFVWIQSGDILKAFGESSLLKLPYVPEDLAFEMIYSEEVLSQIHNTKCVGGNYYTFTSEGESLETTYFGSFDIHELNGKVSQGVKVRYMDSDEIKAKILTMHTSVVNGSFVPLDSVGVDSDTEGTVLDIYVKGQPTPDDVMVATRMTAVTAPFTGSDTVYVQTPDDSGLLVGLSHDLSDSYTYDIDADTEATIAEVVSCGSEVALDFVISSFKVNRLSGHVEMGRYTVPQILVTRSTSTFASLANNVQLCIQGAKLLAAWHYAPMLEYFIRFNDSTVLIPYTQWEVNNSVGISTEVLNGMHDAALYSEFNLGDLGGFKSVR